MRRGRPLKFKTVEDLQEKIDKYMSSTGWKERSDGTKVIRYYEPATITGLALALDTSRETLINYEERTEYFDTIKRAKDMCEHALEYGALTNGINPTMAIFSAKNNYDWKDKTETDVTSNLKIAVVDEKSLAIAKKYEEELKKDL